MLTVVVFEISHFKILFTKSFRKDCQFEPLSGNVMSRNCFANILPIQAVHITIIDKGHQLPVRVNMSGKWILLKSVHCALTVA